MILLQDLFKAPEQGLAIGHRRAGGPRHEPLSGLAPKRADPLSPADS